MHCRISQEEAVGGCKGCGGFSCPKRGRQVAFGALRTTGCDTTRWESGAGTPHRTITLAAVVLGILIPWVPLAAAEPQGKEKRTETPASAVVRRIRNMSFKDLLQPGEADVSLKLQDVPAVESFLWTKYREEQKRAPERLQEHKARRLTFSSSAMRYDYRKIGPRPATGHPLYIALHGGGGAPAQVNDRGWDHMKIYYLSSVTNGVYVAPRGVSNTWNLHFMPHSYPLYDRLIENMILFEDVDPNRVYLLGYSAGGDGVYQVAPRMADRFAAANMSAGHHNGVSPMSLYNLPFLVQVGERDSAYGRNRATVQFSMRLDRLQEQYPEGYVHDVFVHAGRGHGFRDNHPTAPQMILAQPGQWLEKKDSSAKKQNTNAITWLSKYTRNPLPERIVWDLSTRADRTGVDESGKALWLTPNRGRQLYWLDLSGADWKDLGTKEIVARIDGKKNTIVIDGPANRLRVLLSRKMLDLSKPVIVKIGDRQWKMHPTPNLKTLVQTLADRGDPNYMFEAEIVIEKKAGAFIVR